LAMPRWSVDLMRNRAQHLGVVFVPQIVGHNSHVRAFCTIYTSRYIQDSPTTGDDTCG
jgi:hypothetical protein